MISSGDNALPHIFTSSIEPFNGAELSAVPLSSSLIMYASGISNGNPGPSGIGIVIYDKDDHQVGKVSTNIGKVKTNTARFFAIRRSLKIALYFKTSQLRIRTDSDLVVKQIHGEVTIEDKELKKIQQE